MWERNFLKLIFLLCFSITLNALAVSKAKTSYPYLLYLPKAYKESIKKWPVLIYLHGGSQKGDDLNKLKTYGPPSLVEKGKKFEFIIASPQCPDGKYWSTENWFDSLYADLI
ncbi:hypothetical protein BH10BAC3_BH10BAC3_01810 [soil metagenome]